MRHGPEKKGLTKRRPSLAQPPLPSLSLIQLLSPLIPSRPLHIRGERLTMLCLKSLEWVRSKKVESHNKNMAIPTNTCWENQPRSGVSLAGRCQRGEQGVASEARQGVTSKTGRKSEVDRYLSDFETSITCIGRGLIHHDIAELPSSRNLRELYSISHFAGLRDKHRRAHGPPGRGIDHFLFKSL
jgi:hypothetical protein